MTAPTILVTEVPALPAPGGRTFLNVASQSTAGIHYGVTVTVFTDGLVTVTCACPARKNRCKHVAQLEEIYVVIGQAVRLTSGSIRSTAPTQPVVVADDDPFRGLDGGAA